MSGTLVYSTCQSAIKSCRFCYNYKPPGPIATCCSPNVCLTSTYLSTISCASIIANNSAKTTERSLLLQGQQTIFKELNNAQMASTLSSILSNSTSINNTIGGQLNELRAQRYEPYQPYVYPVVPSSVTQLLMNTANAGVPHSFFTIMNCKGSQSVTT